MKKIYVIWESEWGSTRLFFDNKSDAIEYCKIMNDKSNVGGVENIYSYKEYDVFTSLQDYKVSKDYKSILKNAINKLKNNIQKIENSITSFRVDLGDGYHIDLKVAEFETILDNHKDENFGWHLYEAESNGYEDIVGNIVKESRFLNINDLQKIKAGYQNAMSDLKNMQKKLREYKKEYIDLFDTAENSEEEIFM